MNNMKVVEQCQKKKKWYKDASSVFFAITGFVVVVSLSSDIYRFLNKKFPSMNFYNTYVLYSVVTLFLICNVAFIVNSAVSIHKLRMQREKERDAFFEGEYKLKIAMESLLLVAMILYSVKGVMSLYMAASGGEQPAAKFNLWICVLAPMFDLLGALCRVVDSYKYHDDVKKVALKSARARMSLYNNPDFAFSCVNVVLLIFLLVCAVKEIIDLGGHSEGAYDYDDMAIIYADIIIGSLFLITFALGKCLDNRKKSISQEKLESCNSGECMEMMPITHTTSGASR